jgi:hypothetical protein
LLTRRADDASQHVTARAHEEHVRQARAMARDQIVRPRHGPHLLLERTRFGMEHAKTEAAHEVQNVGFVRHLPAARRTAADVEAIGA